VPRSSATNHWHRTGVRKRFGQHFLEPAWVRKVVDRAAPDRADRFLEIGPGRGALTLALAPRVAGIVAVEIDTDLAASLQSVAPPNVHVVSGNFLDTDLPALLHENVARGAARTRVIGNLPYNVSSPILFRLLHFADRFFDATLMVQREVADRLAARPGTGDYGVLTLMTMIYGDVTRLLDLPPGAFRPPPKVRSAVVSIRFRPPLVDVSLLPWYERLVRGVFQQRRKTIANAMRGTLPALESSLIARWLEEAAIDPTRRPETLEVIELTRLAERARAYSGA
jgi:16S rRNA (adenine1518-N6/adenine1519-N6)-dimethyltransferase